MPHLFAMRCTFSRAVLPLLASLALAPCPPAAWSCAIQGSFWHQPADPPDGGYLAVEGAVISLLDVATGEVLAQVVSDAAGAWAFTVPGALDFVVTASGYATLRDLSGAERLAFLGDAPRGFEDGTPVASCGPGDLQFGALHILRADPVALARLPRRPRATVRPGHRGRVGTRFRLKARNFAPGESLFVVEERPDRTARASRLATDPRGIARLTVPGGQSRGRHRWCFRGEQSHHLACVAYRVR